MQPAVSVQDVRGVSPAWLRPSAFVLILCLHWVLLVGIGWPTGTGVAEPPPLEIQVIPRAEPAQLLVPLESASMVEIKPPNAVPVDVQAIEAQPLHGREIAEFKPAAPALATGPPPGVLVSTAPEGATLKSPAAPAPMAPLQVADAALVAASVGASPVPVEPPRLDPLPPSEQQVAELEPLVTRPAAATKSAQPAREASPVVASASGLDPPSKALLPGQPVAESEPMVARPAVRVETAQPGREASPVVASAAGLDPPSKPLQPLAESEPLMAGPTIAAEIVQDAREPPRAEAPASAIGPPSRPLSPKQQVVELEPLAARPAAPVEVAQSASHAPRAEPSSVTINPPSRPLSSEQPPSEPAPLEVAQAAAPVPAGPPTHAVPMGESSAGASNSPSQETVLPSEEQVAKLEPYSPVTAPFQEDGPIISGRVAKIVRYVEQYDGGRCFFVAPVAVTESEAKLEGYGASARPFEALDTAFRHENGFEASIDVRLVNPAQCPAVAFLGRLRGVGAPHLHIDGVNLGPGKVLAGTVDGFGSRNVELLVATDAGTVQNMSHLLKPGTNAKTFAIGRPDIAWASGGQPQLLIVVASPLPLRALRFDRPVAADRIFSAAIGEAERTKQPLAAMARYFKIDSSR